MAMSEILLPHVVIVVAILYSNPSYILIGKHMVTSFKKLWLGFTLLSCSFATSAQIRIENYQDLYQTLIEGNEVRAIIQLSECHSDSQPLEKKPTALAGGLNFSQFNAYQIKINDKPTHIIATSINMLVDSQQHGPAYNYVRLRVFENNQVEIVSMFLKPTDYSTLSKNTFRCALSNKTENRGITLYKTCV